MLHCSTPKRMATKQLNCNTLEKKSQVGIPSLFHSHPFSPAPPLSRTRPSSDREIVRNNIQQELYQKDMIIVLYEDTPLSSSSLLWKYRHHWSVHCRQKISKHLPSLQFPTENFQLSPLLNPAHWFHRPCLHPC